MPLEMVSVDSALVTAAWTSAPRSPNARPRERIPHHLIDIRDPAARYSAGEFMRDARRQQEIWPRGRQPLLVGGTMLYFHALSGHRGSAGRRSGVRAQIDAQGARSGGRRCTRIGEGGPVAAGRIHVNDPQRIQRALEVYRLTGRPSPDCNRSECRRSPTSMSQNLPLRPLNALNCTPGSKRFWRCSMPAFWMRCGVFTHAATSTAEHPAMRAVGYRQLWRHLAGQIGLDEATEQAIAATRQLAKRQLTWLRRRVMRAGWIPCIQKSHRNVQCTVEVRIFRV